MGLAVIEPKMSHEGHEGSERRLCFTILTTLWALGEESGPQTSLDFLKVFP